MSKQRLRTAGDHRQLNHRSENTATASDPQACYRAWAQMIGELMQLANGCPERGQTYWMAAFIRQQTAILERAVHAHPGLREAVEQRGLKR